MLEILSKDGHDLSGRVVVAFFFSLEREMGFEPTTFCLGSRHSTAELLPLFIDYKI